LESNRPRRIYFLVAFLVAFLAFFAFFAMLDHLLSSILARSREVRGSMHRHRT